MKPGISVNTSDYVYFSSICNRGTPSVTVGQVITIF